MFLRRRLLTNVNTVKSMERSIQYCLTGRIQRRYPSDHVSAVHNRGLWIDRPCGGPLGWVDCCAEDGPDVVFRGRSLRPPRYRRAGNSPGDLVVEGRWCREGERRRCPVARPAGTRCVGQPPAHPHGPELCKRWGDYWIESGGDVRALGPIAQRCAVARGLGWCIAVLCRGWGRLCRGRSTASAVVRSSSGCRP